MTASADILPLALSAGDQRVATAIVRKGAVVIESEDADLAVRLARFFQVPAREHARDESGVLRTVELEPGSREHFVSRCHSLHTLGLRARLRETDAT